MQQEIKIPAMGESVTEASIGRFLKSTGDFVNESDEVIELETEKVNQVLYAPTSGVITWNVQVGETVKIGQVIGSVNPEAKVAAAPKPKTPSPPAKEETSPVTRPQQPPPPVQPARGIRFGQREFVEELKAPPKETPPLFPKEIKKEGASKSILPETRRPLSKIRKTIANRLVESLHQAAMLTTFNEVDMSAIIDLRTRHKEGFQKKHGVKLGFMSFFVKAVCDGLNLFPDLNSYIQGEEIVHREYYHIGIAVGTDRGLVVPIVRDCDKLSFAEIEKEIEQYAKKAREGRLAIDDLQGGGFTITNGGVYGSLLSTPILNPPQSGILGMHTIEKRPVVIDDQIIIRPMMYLALSYDHRIVDGKEAVSFLVRVKEVLEDPSLILFEE